MNVPPRLESPRARRLPGVASAASVAVAAVAAAAMVAVAAAPARAEGAAAPAAPPITVTAKLEEIPTKLPPDDLYDYAYVMRYTVIGGPLDKQSILVAHYKPRQPRAAIKDQMKKVVSGKLRSFRQGDVHKLQLTPDLKSVWRGALVDEFSATDRKSIRYFALVADPA
jgi:hypothetical protein